jgi:hypothetical protein
MNYPVRQEIVKETVMLPKELVEKILDGPQAQNCFPGHHLARCHAPSPIGVARIRLKNRSKGKFDFQEEIRQHHSRMPALRNRA